MKWYPGDVYGAFVSASVSGEVLVWDARQFVPAFSTAAYVYNGASGGTEWGSSRQTVAPLQCMDLPKTPEGCPHGSALLALGLGDSGRGAIRLCDAFRGGSVTHELIGHGSGTAYGGVNAILWDPCHPFRLASGGNDCTVRLWDIRKAGSQACLGVLDRQNGIIGGTGAAAEDWARTPVSRKRDKPSIYTNTAHMDGSESHGSPVAALAFAPGGDDLASAGSDGIIHHWDLRPSSCFVNPGAAIGDDSARGRASREGGGRGADPAVAAGGWRAPTCFVSRRGGGRPAETVRRRERAVALAIIQSGSRSTATLISAGTCDSNSASGEQIAGYSLYGRRAKEPGGHPDFLLRGHLSNITCLVTVDGVWDNLKVGGGNDSSTGAVEFLTGGKDGMVLSWGRSIPSHHCPLPDEETNHVYSDKSHDWLSWRRHECGGDLDRTRPVRESPPLCDMDRW